MALKIGFSNHRTGDPDVYYVVSMGLHTSTKVRKSHGIWQYQLRGSDEWVGAYKTRMEAGQVGYGHALDLAVEAHRRRKEAK